MSLIKISGKNAKPALLFLGGFFMMPACALLGLYNSTFVYLIFVGMVAAIIGLVWLLWKKRHDTL